MGIKTNRILIHATNIKGIGAIQVVRSLFEALAQSALLDNATIYVPNIKWFTESDMPRKAGRVIPYNRILPNGLSRVFECLLSHKEYLGFSNTLVLGDIPLHKVSNQTVFAHQTHLISPKVNCYTSKRIKYIIERKIFKYNLKYVDKVIVQTGSMKDQLVLTYPELQDRIAVIPQPAPVWCLNNKINNESLYENQVRLFYPAAGYPHKNHKVIADMATFLGSQQSLIKELIVTLNEAEGKVLLSSIPWVKNVGRIGTSECLKRYHNTDALFFPSLLESYGLPLVEAMTLDIPILCADLPYARWLCEEQAIYFKPTDPSSAWRAVEELHQRLQNGWRVDWQKPLEKLPKDWNSVAKQFAKAMGLVIGNVK